MGVALYPVFEGVNDGWPDDVNGKCLSRASDRLDWVAKREKVRPLMDFFSLTPDQATGEGVEDVYTEVWFDPVDGLKTVRALLKYVCVDGRKIENLNCVREDLEAFERRLLEAAEKNVRWHLVVDY